MRRLFLGFAGAAVIAMAIAQLAAACSGMRMVEDQTDPAYVARVVFTGTVVRSLDEVAGPVFSGLDPIYWTFVVDDVEVGEVGDRFTVESARLSASCGVEFELGQRYRVVAWGGDHPTYPMVTQGDAKPLPPLADAPAVEGEFGAPWQAQVWGYLRDPTTWVVPIAMACLLFIGISYVWRWRRRAGSRPVP